MARAKLKFRLHRTAIILICLALLVLLMQGASYFSLSHQMARSEQVEELAQTLTKQVAYSLAPLLDDDGNTRASTPSSSSSPITAAFSTSACISWTARWSPTPGNR